MTPVCSGCDALRAALRAADRRRLSDAERVRLAEADAERAAMHLDALRRMCRVVAIMLAVGVVVRAVSSDPDALLVGRGLVVAAWVVAVVVSVWPTWAADVWRRGCASLGRRP